MTYQIRKVKGVVLRLPLKKFLTDQRPPSRHPLKVEPSAGRLKCRLNGCLAFMYRNYTSLIDTLVTNNMTLVVRTPTELGLQHAVE